MPAHQGLRALDARCPSSEARFTIAKLPHDKFAILQSEFAANLDRYDNPASL